MGLLYSKMQQSLQKRGLRKYHRCLLCACLFVTLSAFAPQQVWVMLTSMESFPVVTFSRTSGSFTQLSKRNILVSHLQLSHEFVEELAEETIDQLLGRALSLNRTKILLLDPQFGLGNRLRAIASCMAFAEATSRLLVLIWGRDAHMGAAFEDLIGGYPEFMLSIPNFSTRKPVHEYLIDFRVYDLMASDEVGRRKSARLEIDHGHHIYLRTAFMLKSPLAQKPSMWLKKLVPLASIQNMFALKKDVEYIIAVHIRGLSLEDESFVAPTRAYPIHSRNFLEKWRGITGNATIFAEQMSRLLQSNDRLSFFVLSDKGSIIQHLKKVFHDKIFALENCCTTRTVKCVRCAFAGIVLASRMKGFLGSYGSSYSESIILLGKKRHKFVKLAGVDF